MSSKVIRFVTDSTCDLPPEVLQKHKISVVPAFINHSGKSFADDGRELNRLDYYREMPNLATHPTTAAPPPALSEQIITQAFAECDHLIIVCAPATLSGIYNSLRLGASNLPADRVTQIDGGTISMGLGYQVLLGAEAAAATGDVNATLDVMERVRRNQRVYAAPESMEYLRRSGRVGWAAAGAAQLLQIKPIVVAHDGKIDSIARVRTFGKAVDKLVELAQEQGPLERLTVLHADNEQGAADIRAGMGSGLTAEVQTVMVTPVIGTHIGPKAVGVVTLKQGWRTS